MRQVEFQQAYILHSRPYRETSLLLEFFTREHGRMGAVAKGVRSPKSRARGLLQPFVPLLVTCVGRGELLTLKEFDSAGAMPWLKGRRLVSAFYLNEILMRLLHRWDPNSDLFCEYRNALFALVECSQEQEVLRLFEKSLLKAMGYELQLDKEVETGFKIQAESVYTFDPERGPFLVKSEYSEKDPQQSKHLFKGKSLLALSEGKLDEASVLWDAKRLMRQALAPHLGHKPLESRRLL